MRPDRTIVVKDGKVTDCIVNDRRVIRAWATADRQLVCLATEKLCSGTYWGVIMDDLGVPVVLVGDTSGPEPRLRTAFRTDDP